MIKESPRNILMKLICLATLMSTPFILTACGGGGGGGSSSSSDVGSSSGTVSTTSATFQAVDPYITGAVFQEIAQDGQTLLQRSSTSSDAQGRFTFPEEVTPGSTIELKAGSKGMHLGSNYQGMLRFRVPVEGADDATTQVVSPLTTLEANGFDPQDIIDMLDNAGLSGMTLADLNADPMAGLSGQTSGVTAAELRRLQANMAVNALLETLDNPDLGPADMYNADNTQLFNDIVGATVDTLNPTLYDQMAAEVGQQTGVTVRIDDLIYAAVNSQGTMVGRMKEAIVASGLPLPATLLSTAVTDCLAQTGTWMANQAQMRGSSNAGSGGTTGNTGNTGNTGGSGSTSSVSGQAVYDADCSSCHSLGSYDTTGFMTLLGKGSMVAGKISGGHNGISLTADELTALAAWVDNPTPSTSGTTTPDPGTGTTTPDPGTGTTTPDPGTGTTSDGQTVYDQNCAPCHSLGSYDTSGGIDLAGKGNLVDAKLAAGHNGITLSAADEAALITWIDSQTSGGTTVPPVTTDGATLYAQECQGCHNPLATTTIVNRTAAAIESAIAANLGGMGTISLDATQVQAIVDVLPVATTPDPGTGTQPADGASLYDGNCAACHQIATYDNAGTAPDLGGKGSLIAAKLGAGHMGMSLAAADIDTLAAWLDTFTAVVVTDPTPTDCTACHGQPPNGVDFPNGAGAHAVHMALAAIDGCLTCHQGADHNGVVDLGLPANYDAKSGMAVVNNDSTCSNVSCHGGQTTPDWWTGQLAVASECTACHASGTSQYNSYNSGDHRRHSGYACTVCHNTTKLAAQHFSNLSTTAFEGAASATIGGGSTRISSYDPNTKRCVGCHSAETW